MKINLFYLLVPAALAFCYFIVRDLQGQSVHSFFGTAETEPTLLSIDYDCKAAQVLVKIGDEVKAGDTLAIMFRSEIDQNEFLLRADLQNNHTELNARKTELANELSILQVEHQQRLLDLSLEIREIEVRDSLEQAVRGALLPGVKTVNQASQQAIAAAKQSISQENTRFERESNLLLDQIKSQTAISIAKQAVTQGKQKWQLADRNALYLIAPVSGYVDQVNISNGAAIQAYKDLLRIYPLTAKKVIGFIHESSNIPFHIGDSVSMSSATRPEVQCRGQVIAASPKLVELPLRLRKFVEVRAWGREVMILIPQDNRFYIGEKVSIAINQHEE
jgi:multidrug resistance efflux pump